MKKLIVLALLTVATTSSLLANHKIVDNEKGNQANTSYQFAACFDEGTYVITIKDNNGVVAVITGCWWIGEDGKTHGSERVTVTYPDGTVVIYPPSEWSGNGSDHRDIEIFQTDPSLQSQYLQELAAYFES